MSKTSVFKRGLTAFMAMLLCLSSFIGLGTTTAYAAGEQAEVYMISFPRDGDANYGGDWGHPNLHYMNGWTSGSSSKTTIRAMGSYTGIACYCIEPGVTQNTGDVLTKWDENFWDNYPSNLNNTISPDEIKTFIGRIFQYGYTGNISLDWRSQNEGANNLSHLIATQILVWETVVGERDSNFQKVDTGGYDAVLDQISTGHPLYNQIMSYYNSMAASVQNHTKLPSFMSKTADSAQTFEFEWDGSQYTDDGSTQIETPEEGAEFQIYLKSAGSYLSVLPVGANQFGAQFERVLPASSVANLYPFNFSGKTDPRGIYLGRDKYGTNILVDFDRRSEDKTTSNILILGNSGQGKSYLLKLILTNLREAGKLIIALDVEAEYEELTQALGGCYIDFMSGEYIVNPLEPKAWGDGTEGEIDATTPLAFRKVTRLSQHIAFLKDFFRAYKDFSDVQIDTIEILLAKLYARFGITDTTDYSTKKHTDFPIMEDFYKLCEEEFMTYDKQRKYLYTEETLQQVCLGIHSMCVGSESKYFNGYTNITDDAFLCFGVKGLMDTNRRLKDAMLFNLLSFMSNQLLGVGNTAAAIDELYMYLTNLTAIEYIRNSMKRVRKKDSAIIIASQNINDFLLPEVCEMTKPLFSIPTHQFLFNPGQINPAEFMDALQVEPSEFELIKYPERGTCLYRCGIERYLLQVIAPDYKAAIFGKAGGR